MQNLWTKFKKLKTGIGGNREKRGFEYSFGAPPEQQWNITPPNRWNSRILSQLEFALRLTAEKEGRQKDEFEEAVSKALDFLLAHMEKDGVLANSVCGEAEKLLLPLQEAAKEYGLILAAHAHIDMNWMWGWQETVAATLDTFRTMLDLMDEYPDFTFSQSQASVYKITEDFDPELMGRIKERIKEGRWEITASAWVETDKNMPDAESLLRHIKYARDYLGEHWGIDPDSLEVDFSPDTFGHSANVPEINSFGNVKYYYQCRGLDGDEILFRWKAPSGKEVLVCRENNWYNRGIADDMATGLPELSKRCGGLKTGLVVYGVGDHGGGATRRDIETAAEMMDYPIYPKIKFGTFREFFKLTESVREKLSVLDFELNYLAPGCYTTQSRIKLGNRKSEKALIEADLYSSLSSAYLKSPYYRRQFEKAWQNVLFTHFHDILTGSCVQETREHAMGLYSESMAVANTRHSNALRLIAENIDTSRIATDAGMKNSQSEGAGVGYGLSNYAGIPTAERGSGLVRIYHVFNPLPFERAKNVEITVWDWTGDMRYIDLAYAESGKKVEFAKMDNRMQDYWSHKYFRILANVTVPALGYATIVLKEEQKDEYIHYFHDNARTTRPYGAYILENEYIKAEFDTKSGYLSSLIDKETGEDALLCGKFAGLEFVQTENATSDAWNIGHYMKIEPIDKVAKIHPVGFGALKNGFFIERKIRNSTIKETVSLEKGSKALEYCLDIDWNESAGADFAPVLHYNFPLGQKVSEFLYDVPAGAQKRGAMNLDVPGLRYGAAINPDGKKSLVIASDCKYGYRAYEGNFSATLINTSKYPDPYPETGIHRINLFVGFERPCPKALSDYASNLLNSLCYATSKNHKGILPLQKSLMGFEGDSAVLSSVSMTADDCMLVRFFETCGKACGVSITLGVSAKEAHMTDLMERECAKCEITEENGITKIAAKLMPNSIGAVKIKFAK
ncbi:MAG: hypothetical protein FWG34_00515 [Oscillospiraceae bacterium]|nr:hypothetical protein [Oscillospiraceae bacterium]